MAQFASSAVSPGLPATRRWCSSSLDSPRECLAAQDDRKIGQAPTGKARVPAGGDWPVPPQMWVWPNWWPVGLLLGRPLFRHVVTEHWRHTRLASNHSPGRWHQLGRRRGGCVLRLHFQHVAHGFHHSPDGHKVEAGLPAGHHHVQSAHPDPCQFSRHRSICHGMGYLLGTLGPLLGGAFFVATGAWALPIVVFALTVFRCCWVLG